MNDRLERNKTTVTTFYDLTFNQCGCCFLAEKACLPFSRGEVSLPGLPVLDEGERSRVNLGLCDAWGSCQAALL